MNNKPWTIKLWLLDRIKEFFWQNTSTAYIVAWAATFNFFARGDGTSRDFAIAMWGIAFGVRFIAAPLADAKAQQMQPSVPKEPSPPTPPKGAP